jgi:aminoglycoside phosphotransferase (APT) family kinase protein
MTDSANVRSAHDRQDTLACWAADLVGESSVTLKRRPGGGSHQAWDVLAGGEARWFLRADAVEPDEQKHYTLRREAEIYRAVNLIGIPSPAVLGIHPELEAVLLERSSGDAAFARLDPAVQTEIIDDFAPWLARIHAADPATLDLPSLLPAATVFEAVHHELELWEARLDASGVPDPILTACFQWLRDNVPDTGDARPSIVQGDTGPGNFLHDGHRVTAFLDFELGHLGDPMEDLAWVGTRNAQEPVPDFERFLAHYAAAAGTPPDRDRIRYHALFAELRIAALGAERLGAEADLEAEHGNRLIYGALHRRLTVEALAAAMGTELPSVELPVLADTDDTRYFDAALHQMQHRIGPEISDPWASRLLKGLARVTKYLREVDRSGGIHERAELDDLEALLGERPTAIHEGSAALLERVRARDVSASDLLPHAAGQVARRTQLVGPAMGRLATSHLPVI